MVQKKKSQASKKRSSARAKRAQPSQSISLKDLRIDAGVSVVFGEDFTETYKDVAKAVAASAEAASWAAIAANKLAKGLSSSQITINREPSISINPNADAVAEISGAEFSSVDFDSRG